MNDQITDERLAELLDFEDGLANEPFIVGERRRYKADVASALRELAALREQVRWIPVTERPPPQDGAVQLYFDDPAYRNSTTTPPVVTCYYDAYYAPGGSGFSGGDGWVIACAGEEVSLHYSDPPTHWRPIGPLPGGEG